MGYHFEGLLGKEKSLKAFQNLHPECQIVNLHQDLFVIPFVEEKIQKTDSINSEIKKISQLDKIAYLEACFHGGRGYQNAELYENGLCRVFKDDRNAFNKILKIFEVYAKWFKDEFDTVNFGRHRKTEDWLNSEEIYQKNLKNN